MGRQFGQTKAVFDARELLGVNELRQRVRRLEGRLGRLADGFTKHRATFGKLYQVYYASMVRRRDQTNRTARRKKAVLASLKYLAGTMRKQTPTLRNLIKQRRIGLRIPYLTQTEWAKLKRYLRADHRKVSRGRKGRSIASQYKNGGSITVAGGKHG